MQLDLGSLREQYKSGHATPTEVVAATYEKIAASSLEPVWISLVPRDKSMARARKLERDPLAAVRPLYGVPFAIQDNIDLAGVPTTAGCPAFNYTPGHSAAVVRALIDAGAIPVGKTTMDPFSVDGGAKSGAALAVAAGLAAFALATDTGGGGNVPAALNGIVGLKPTRGTLSMRGVVPACPTLDCVSVFTFNCDDAQTVWTAARGYDPADALSRAPRAGADAAPWLAGDFAFGVPRPGQWEFSGDAASAALYAAAAARLESLGGRKVEIDFTPFRAASELLDSPTWDAERYTVLREFLAQHLHDLDPVVGGRLERGRQCSAVDAFTAAYLLREIRRSSQTQWECMDLLVLPTVPATGGCTGFVNLLDLAAVAVPAGRLPGGTSFGISLIGPAFSEEALLVLGGRYAGTPVARESVAPPGCVALAVLGPYLSGQPLNWHLAERGARRLKTCRTAPGYRLYALESMRPAKPGLVRDDNFRGPGVEVEVWAVPEHEFGGFVAAVPPPLAIGSAVLDDGETVKCLLCESAALEGAHEITRLGGWKHYLSQPAVR